MYINSIVVLTVVLTPQSITTTTINSTLSSLSFFFFHTQQYNSHHFLSIFLIFKIIKTSFIHSSTYYHISPFLTIWNYQILLFIYIKTLNAFFYAQRRDRKTYYTPLDRQLSKLHFNTFQTKRTPLCITHFSKYYNFTLLTTVLNIYTHKNNIHHHQDQLASTNNLMSKQDQL